MASPGLSVEELHELVAALAQALGDLQTWEDGGEAEVPEELEKELQQRDALAKTFEELPEDVRGRARTIYVRKLAEAKEDWEPTMVPMDVDLNGVEEALDRVRAAHLRDSALYAVVRRDAPAVGWV